MQKPRQTNETAHSNENSVAGCPLGTTGTGVRGRFIVGTALARAATRAAEIPGHLVEPACGTARGAVEGCRSLGAYDARGKGACGSAFQELAIPHAAATCGGPAALPRIPPIAAARASPYPRKFSALPLAAAGASTRIARTLAELACGAPPRDSRTDASEKRRGLNRLHCLDELRHCSLAVAVQHARVVQIEERVLDP